MSRNVEFLINKKHTFFYGEEDNIDGLKTTDFLCLKWQDLSSRDIQKDEIEEYLAQLKIYYLLSRSKYYDIKEEIYKDRIVCINRGIDFVKTMKERDTLIVRYT